MTTIRTIATDEVWANVRDGGLSHLVLVDQLLTSQAAKCGYDPGDFAAWMLTDGKSGRPSSGKCAACRRK